MPTKRALPDFIGHVVLAQQSNGPAIAFGPFDTEADAEAFALAANGWPQDTQQYTALYMLPPSQHHTANLAAAQDSIDRHHAVTVTHTVDAQ